MTKKKDPKKTETPSKAKPTKGKKPSTEDQIKKLQAEYKTLYGKETKLKNVKTLENLIAKKKKIKGQAQAVTDPKQAYENVMDMVENALTVYSELEPGAPNAPIGTIMITAQVNGQIGISNSKGMGSDQIQAMLDTSQRQVQGMISIQLVKDVLTAYGVIQEGQQPVQNPPDGKAPTPPKAPESKAVKDNQPDGKEVA